VGDSADLRSSVLRTAEYRDFRLRTVLAQNSKSNSYEHSLGEGRLNCGRSSRLLFVVVALFLSGSLVSPAFAIVPQVRSVIPYNVGSTTYLNVTVYHQPEEQLHYVNTIRVTMGGNTTDLTIGPQPLTPPDFVNFTVAYPLGPVSGTPTITVDAHCTIHGWASPNWTGQIPEFSTAVLLMTLALATVVVAFVLRKFRSNIRS